MLDFQCRDSAMEWSFFVTEDALERLQPSLERNEESLLLALERPSTLPQ